MKIEKVELKKDCGKSLCISNQNLYALTVTTKKLFGRKKTFDAYPTNYGPTYGSPSVLFYYYCDESGKELSDELSQALNNFCITIDLKNNG